MSAMVPKQKFFIVLTHLIKKGDKKYIVICPELDVAAQDDSIEEANESLTDATLLYLEGIEKLGTMEIIFKEKNIKKYSSQPKKITEEIDLTYPDGYLIEKRTLPIAC